MPLSRYDIKCLYAAREMIVADISRHYTIEQISRNIGLNSTKLKKGFKELFKMNLFEYLEMQRLERAKILMSDADKPLKQISKLTGFQYYNNFSRAFKRKFGVTPQKWRKGLHSILGITGHFSLLDFDMVTSLFT